MRGWWTTLAFCFWATIGSANPFPALYDVTGVASDDVLNVRAAPDASADKIDVLSFAQTQIEVVATSDDHKWGLINIGEGSGWVSMSFLTRWPGQDRGNFQMPTACYGTEPFWDLTGLQKDELVLQTMDDTTMTYRMTTSMGTFGRIGVHWLVGEFDGQEIHATLHQTRCHDGMSDREYGLSIDLLAETGDDGPFALSGCCTLASQ